MKSHKDYIHDPSNYISVCDIVTNFSLFFGQAIIELKLIRDKSFCAENKQIYYSGILRGNTNTKTRL